MPLGEWLDRWLEEYAAPSVRPSTLEGYRGYLERNIKPRLGNKPVGKITVEDIRQLYRELQEHGRQEEHPQYGYKLAGSTVRRIHGVLHEALDAAAQENLIARNPTDGIILPRKKAAPKQVLNNAQLERFMTAIQEDKVWHDFFYTELTICQYQDQSGALHKVAVFVMILGYSRTKYIEFVSRCDLRSMERCMLNAFLYFGGVPKEVLTDNMKTVVAGREAGKVIWNTQFSDFAVEMGFLPKVCRVRKPQTKGKVERLVRYVKENFFPGRKFTDLEDLNRQALLWCKTVDSKPHGTTGKVPLQVLPAEELLPLPAQEIQDRYRWERRTVTREGLVSFDGIRYGVPWQYSGKEVQVRLCSGFVEIYYGEMLLVRHQVQYHTGKIIWLPGQYKGLAEHKGIAAPYPAAQQQDLQVEVRPLQFYDRLLGGSAHG